MEARPKPRGAVLHGARGYDLVVWLFTLGRERRFREKLLALAGLQEGESVLDVGCGTGTLALLAKERVGSAVVTGIDASPQMVARAKRKAARAGAAVEFLEASADALPFPEARFDLVLSTLMLHHLGAEARRQ